MNGTTTYRLQDPITNTSAEWSVKSGLEAQQAVVLGYSQQNSISRLHVQVCRSASESPGGTLRSNLYYSLRFVETGGKAWRPPRFWRVSSVARDSDWLLWDLLCKRLPILTLQ